jgi:peptidoglycan LD-endopeptidase LytH
VARPRHAGPVALVVASLAIAACTQSERYKAIRGDSQAVSDSSTAPTGSLASDTSVPAPRVDTVVRIDTVLRVDTVVALGTPSARAVAPAPAESPAGGALPVTEEDLRWLRGRNLIVPVAGVSAAKIPSSFSDMRGTRQHNAIDILAPRGTPVLSADDGVVAKIDTSDGGGLSLYLAGPQERFIFYYAHLDAYRRGIAEGMRIAKGDTIGYVGTTGNAPPNTPHLHFAIARADRDKRWWKGTPLDPLPLLRDD